MAVAATLTPVSTPPINVGGRDLTQDSLSAIVVSRERERVERGVRERRTYVRVIKFSFTSILYKLSKLILERT